MKYRFFIVFAFLWTVAAFSISQLSPALAQVNHKPLNAEEWRALTAGNTVRYSLMGKHHGLESYDPTGPNVYWRDSDGSCMRGTLSTYEAYGETVFCFNWEASTQWCGRHFRDPEGNYYAQKVLNDGQLDPNAIQHIVLGIFNKSAPCSAEQTS